MYIRVCMQAHCDRMCYQKWILLNGKRKQLHYKLCAIFLQIENRRRRAPTNARDGAKCSCGCMMHEAKRGATMAALNLLFSSSQNRKEAEPNGPKKTIKLHTHTYTFVHAPINAASVCVCVNMFSLSHCQWLTHETTANHIVWLHVHTCSLCMRVPLDVCVCARARAYRWLMAWARVREREHGQCK